MHRPNELFEGDEAGDRLQPLNRRRMKGHDRADVVKLQVLVFSSVGLQPYFAEEHEDSEQAIAYLAQRVQANDVLYVHSSMREQFRLYNRTMPVSASKIVYGRIGMPCCPRKDYRSPTQASFRTLRMKFHLWLMRRSEGPFGS